ncbi:hypothetical protein [uncultured Clostridium sp.]|uniref:hypothetical protein n=1 Tax=uncultured Clostridium sp. TaxID=59620 RepID=UPI0025FD01A7|nr:hypothetical protein [uncultured Clostridium sp.]
MKKKLTIMTLSGLVALNIIPDAAPVYAVENKKVGDSVEIQSSKSSQTIYVGQRNGNTYVSDGSISKPYDDIKTALEKVSDGGTLIILDSVAYTKYDKDEVGAALPLFINKNITIQGKGSSSSFSSRAPIQLGADVTFKDISLEMIPEVILGREAGSSGESRMLGQKVPRSATIFAAGHELTLDNVRTKVGSNSDEDRPYISGGTYKKRDNNMGSKSIINIVNGNDETKFSAIYAGDYWSNRNMDVEINIDGKAKTVDKKIHTGGVDFNLTGTVDINLKGSNNIADIDKTNYSGDVNVTLQESNAIYELNLQEINELTLENNVKLVMPQNAEFEVNNVTLGQNSRIDFRNMSKKGDAAKNPVIHYDLRGTANTGNAAEYGCVLISNTQTLEIGENVTGTTKLNVGSSVDSIDKFKKNHQYVKAGANAEGTFSIKGTNELNCKVKKSIAGNETIWTIVEKDGSEETDDPFGRFEWNGGSNKIVLPSSLDEFDDELEYSFLVRFINTDGEEYTPDQLTLNTSFTYTLEKDGKIFDLDSYDAELMWDENESKLNMYIYTLNHADDLYGNYKLSVIHDETSAMITRNISIVSETSQSKELTGTVSITGDAIEGNTISADISQLPSDCEGIKYEWYVGDKAVSGADTEDFKLTSKHVGKNVKVKVTADNYSGSIFSDEVVVEKKEIQNPVPTPPQPDETPDVDIKYDKSELQELYDRCINAAYLESEYTQDSFEIYKNALKEAEEILKSEKTTQSEIDKAQDKLEKAVAGLKKQSTEAGGSTPGEIPDVDTKPNPDDNKPGGKPESKPDDKPENPGKDEDVKYDKTELQKLYDKCINSAYLESQYTQDSFKIYKNALKEAEEILKSEKTTQLEINKAQDKLEKAVNGLKKKSSSNGGSSNSGGSSSGGSSGGGSSSGGSSSGGGSSSSGSSSSGGSSSSDGDSITGSSSNSGNENSSDNKDNKSEVNKDNNTSTSDKKTDWNMKDGKWYIKQEDGSNAKGWYKDQTSGKWYMLDKNTGAMKTGWHKDDNGKWYHLSNSGEMNIGWHKDTDGKWYHLDNSGAMNTGWLKDTNGKWYHLDNSGAMNTGWFKDTNGKWYNLDSSGAMNTGWLKDNNGKWYYLNSDGSMASNTIINGYRLGKDGAWIR